MWFKNLRIYRLDTAFALSAQQLADMLAKHQFAPGGSQEPLSLGWVSPREGGELVHEVNGQSNLTQDLLRKSSFRSIHL